MKQFILILIGHKLIEVFTLCCLLASSQKNYAQEFGNQGEGHIMVKTYTSYQPFTPVNNTEPPPIEYNFYIKDSLVLREPYEETNFPSENSQKIIQDETREDVNIKFSFSAKVIQPKYIIDLKGAEVFVIQVIRDTAFFYRENIKVNKENIFYKEFNWKKSLIHFEQNSSRIIAGRRCKMGWFNLNSEKNIANVKKIRFWYSENKSRPISPLNNFISVNFPYNVFAISLPISGNGKNLKDGYLNYEIDLLKQEPVKLEKFDFPDKRKEVNRKTWWELNIQEAAAQYERELGN
ncbi:hypothetical protein SAMN04487907_10714 [Zunongwangia mangrovi]|uniref:Uncharacterized protein n=1 Tax=Zunongwangia mangrovi TaxID=1334022 RepID=A0A1I1L2B0_9FLAO|nr:hypothetical protein [Zunongwangia mangrovi]SFC67075.1 hypothetical protein SAMN04487907_10714 [Zunongwangia mangrovi]